MFIGQIINFLLRIVFGQALKNPAILAGLGGLLANGGLSKILGQLQQAGLGDMVKGWVANGPNPKIDPRRLSEALGDEEMERLAREAGMPRDRLAKELAQALPVAVDKLTPNGMLPSADELDNRLSNPDWWK